MQADELDHYTDYAIGRAKAYVEQYKNTPRLEGNTPEETADINRFLDTDPYSKPEVRTAVKAILARTLAPARPADAGEKPLVIHLSGPLGANKLLRELAAEGRTATGREVAKALATAVQSDFAAYKSGLSEQLLGGAPVQPYGKWRPLLSGIDQAVQQAVEEQKFNLVVDNTWAMADDERQRGLDYLNRQKETNELHMYAVALTPEEAKKEAAELGVSPAEAARTARDFRNSWPELARLMPNLTLVDRQGAILFQRDEYGHETYKPDRLAQWYKAVNRGQDQGRAR